MEGTWRVPVLEVPLAAAAGMLGELFDTGPWSGGLVTEVARVTTAEAGARVEVDVAYGASLRWLVAVHDLAWRTVRSGQVLPAVAGGRARWTPAPRSWSAWRRLAAAAPGSVLQGAVAHVVVDQVMDALVDAEARAALATRPPLLGVGRGRRAGPDRPEELLVEALTSPTGMVDAPLLDVQLAAWARSAVAPARGLRTCFRLVEPEATGFGEAGLVTADEGEDRWTLQLLLQLVDTPSVTVPAEDVWGDGASLRALERIVDDPVEIFVADVARAAGLVTLLRRAAAQDRPTELLLTRAEALAFLREGGAALVEAGFGVLLPTWWGGQTRLALAMTARAQPAVPAMGPSPSDGRVDLPALLDRAAILDVRWDALLGASRLTRDELLDLAEATVPLVRVRGRWVEVDPAQIAAAVAFLERQPPSQSLADVARQALDPVAGGLDVVEVDADGALGALLRGEADPPAEASGAEPQTLRPYQQHGVAWLAQLAGFGLGGVLADDMGLGKTVQVLALLARSAGPTLVVCPLTMVGTWEREAARFAPGLTVQIHHGSSRVLLDADLVITTYGLLVRDLALLQGVPWRRVVLDEAQTVKNPSTQMARAVRALPAGQKIALTGTPVENRLADLHTLLDLTNPGLFGTLGEFTARWAIPVERDGDETAAAALARRIRPVVLRRRKSDPAVGAELPARNEMAVWCTLTAEQAGLYKAVVDDMMVRLKGAKGVARRGAVLSTLTRLRQVCNHPAHLLKDGSPLAGRSGKVARLERILDEATALGDRTLCFTQFTAFGAPLAQHLAQRSGLEVPFLHGGLSPAARDRLVERFQADGGPAVLVLSLKAGGTGLTLTAANQVVHVDRWWNPAVEDQASDRVHRIGQTRDVQIRKLVCLGTLEEKIDAMLTAKRGLAERVLSSDGLGGQFTETTDDELAELVRLDPAGVQDDG